RRIREAHSRARVGGSESCARASRLEMNRNGVSPAETVQRSSLLTALIEDADRPLSNLSRSFVAARWARSAGSEPLSEVLMVTAVCPAIRSTPTSFRPRFSEVEVTGIVWTRLEIPACAEVT